ncbi:MAG: hypothetical protein ABSA65_08120 [Acidimicrobiales bacterium]
MAKGSERSTGTHGLEVPEARADARQVVEAVDYAEAYHVRVGSRERRPDVIAHP